MLQKLKLKTFFANFVINILAMALMSSAFWWFRDFIDWAMSIINLPKQFVLGGGIAGFILYWISMND